jgi:hypothetical protein
MGIEQIGDPVQKTLGAELAPFHADAPQQRVASNQRAWMLLRSAITKRVSEMSTALALVVRALNAQPRSGSPAIRARRRR